MKSREKSIEFVQLFTNKNGQIVKVFTPIAVKPLNYHLPSEVI